MLERPGLAESVPLLSKQRLAACRLSWAGEVRSWKRAMPQPQRLSQPSRRNGREPLPAPFGAPSTAAKYPCYTKLTMD